MADARIPRRLLVAPGGAPPARRRRTRPSRGPARVAAGAAGSSPGPPRTGAPRARRSGRRRTPRAGSSARPARAAHPRSRASAAGPYRRRRAPPARAGSDRRHRCPAGGDTPHLRAEVEPRAHQRRLRGRGRVGPGGGAVGRLGVVDVDLPKPALLALFAVVVAVGIMEPLHEAGVADLVEHHALVDDRMVRGQLGRPPAPGGHVAEVVRRGRGVSQARLPPERVVDALGGAAGRAASGGGTRAGSPSPARARTT